MSACKYNMRSREKTNHVLLLLGTLLTFLHVVSSAPVNVALNKPIRALFTCGYFLRESYYDHKDVPKAAGDRAILKCDDTTVHPPPAMVDGDATTNWQSTNYEFFTEMGNFTSEAFPKSTNKLNAVIYLDLKQSFTVEKIFLKMGDALRPNFIAVHKSDDLGLGYATWAYKVNFVKECVDKFSVPAINVPKNQGSAVCSRYKQDTAKPFETIEFDFTAVPTEFREWRRARFIRIEFYEIQRIISVEAVLFHHFAVSELEVMAECVCNGHQIDCILSNETQIYECVCGGNTVGQFCERCQPFFNQKAWQFEVPCEECNCYNHATECTYVKDLEDNQLSLNKAGLRIGGGQCLNCQHNTAGVNCEKCLVNYYRPATVLQNDPNVCVLCECNIAGSTANPVSDTVGDCVMNNDVAPPSGMQPGDCFCKTNVMGSKCDTCRPGFYGLIETNTVGCQACECNPAGTVGGSQTCIPDQTGQCSCKANVEGRACDVCKDGFYGLTVDDPNGCKPCDCDRGGAASATCEKTSGQCYCRPNLQGRQCTSTIPGYYSPDVHFIYVDFETTLGAVTYRAVPGFQGNGYIQLGYAESITPLLDFPLGTTLSRTCALLIRYSAPAATQASVQITSSDDPRPITIPFPACPGSWCYKNTVTFRNVTLNGPPPHAVRFMAIGTLLLDRLVCVPVEFLSPDALLGSSDFSTNCDVFNNDLKLGTALENTCKSGVLTLMSYYLNGPRPCECSRLGSANTVCDSFGGNCQCKLGVGERRCDQCKPGFFQLTDTGCTDCNCATTTGVCDAVTGQCKCPPNTIGLQCNQCDFNTWGWDATAGCKQCNCNSTGSERTWCNITTGVCTCKNGVQGEKCDQCADTYKDFNILGCSRCGCDSTGAFNDVCDKVSGQCQCKGNAGGPLCNQCQPGSFHLHASYSKGCLDCICMGVASQCYSSTGRHQQKTVVLIESKGGGLSGTISVVDSSGGALTSPAVEVPPSSNGIATQTSVTVVVSPSGNVFWKIPDLTGNLLQLYGGIVQADVRYTDIVQVGTPVAAKAILIGRNNKQFVYDVPAFAMNVTTNIRIALKESDWKNEGDSSSVTRGDFLLALTNVQIIMVPAVFTNTDHASFLSHLEYPVDGLGGVVADSVERCQCGTAYTGLSCESCAVGYMRTNVTSHAYLGVCVPCECNNHATRCDPDTGECLDCQHNTAGPKCELCAVGFYGDATGGLPSDCTQCPCYEPRVANKTCSMVDTTIKCSFCNPGYTGDFCDSCLSFHYGNPSIVGVGTCTPCNCNGRSNICNTLSGQCLSCQGNTTGFNCERCIDGYYHNNVTNTCEVCGCVTESSTNTICNPTNGTCPCFNGIGGRTCDKCLDNYWGYTDPTPGCVACTCMEMGSVSLQCDPTTGVCACRPSVATVGTTQQCNQCVAGYYGLPDIPCQACDCDPTGSDPLGGACNLVTGQCPCKRGVTGRQCDRCKTLYIGFSDTGCTACGQCQSSLGSDSQKLETKWSEAYNLSQVVAGVQTQDKQLQVLQTELDTTMTNLGLSGSSITSVNEMTNNITAMEATITLDVDTLKTKVTNLKGSCAIQQNNTYRENERLKALLTASFNTLDLSRTETQKGFNYQYRLQQYNLSAQQYLGKSTTTGSGLGLNFDTQLNKANADYLTILNDQRVEDMMLKTDQQGAAITSLLIVEKSVRVNYSTQSKDMTDMDAVLTTLKNLEEEITIKQAEAKAYKQQTEGNLTETSASEAQINNISTTAETSRLAASEAHQQCQAIMSGTAAPFLTNVTLPSGVSNWNQGYAELEQLQTNIGTQEPITKSSIEASERQAQALIAQAGQLNKTFNDIRLRGDAAVKAIANFEKVIVTLENSLSTADQAKKTIEDAQRNLATLTVVVLETQANVSRGKSEELLAMVNGINYEPEVLNSRLASGRTGLRVAQAQWPPIETRLLQLQQFAEALNSNTGASGVSSIVTEAQNLAGQANSAAAITLSTLTSLNATLNGEKAKAEAVKTQVNRAVNLTSTVEQGARSLAGRVDSLTRSVESITQQRKYAASKQPLLDSKIASIVTKLQQAKELLGRLRNPVNFNGTSGISITNPSQGVSLPYTDVQFQFKKDITVTNALLFFTENTVSTEKFSVEIVDNRVQMESINSGGSATLFSQADLCDNCWFKVQASKYYTTGHLTVTLLSTGGIASVTANSASWTSLSLNSPLYYGSLPTSVVTSKVTSRTGFRGCMHDVWFNGAYIDIWKESITSENTPTCCRKPAVTTPSLDPGVSFDGFGSLVLSAGNLDVSLTPLTLSLKFRTYNPNAYLILVASDNLPVKLSLYLTNGYIVFEYGTVGAVENRIQTSVHYNTGKWFVVAATRSTQNSLEVYQDDDPKIKEIVQPITANSVDLSSLRGANITIGSDQSPNSVNLATESKRFSGCMKEFSYREANGPTNQLSLSIGVVRQSGTSTAGCPAKVMPGIRFVTTSSYMRLSLPTVTSITTISLDIITTSANGILVYIQDQVAPSRVLYLSLFHGNLVLDYRMTSSSRLSTDGIYVSDGLRHSVRVDMLNSPVISVDGQSFIDNNLPSSTFTKSSGTSVYIGGSSNNSVPGSNYPVRSSFVGGISNLQIDSVAVDVFAEGTLSAQQGSDLSGIPEPPSSPPPIPFTTPVPPTTPTPPTCGSTKVPPTNPNGIWFTGNSYWRKILTVLEPEFYRDSFTLSIEFEAFGRNGLLFMAADHVTTPQQWALIYLQDGYLHFNVTGPSANLYLKSRERYNDGKNYTVDCLLYGTYMIMAESTIRKDYVVGETGDIDAAHILTNIAEIIIGGVADPVTRPTYLPGLPAVTNFQGAVYGVTVHSKNLGTTSYNLNPSHPTVTTQNIEAVPYPVGYGVSLNGPSAVINIGCSFSKCADPGNRDVFDSLKVNLTLSNIKPSAMLFYIYESSNTFLALDTMEYRIRVVVGSGAASAFTVISSDPTNFCDGNPHTYLLNINNTGVEIKVDANSAQFHTYPQNFFMPTMTAGTIIIGGLHDSGLPFQAPVSRTSMQGCVQDVNINNMVYDLPLYLSNSIGVSLACPL